GPGRAAVLRRLPGEPRPERGAPRSPEAAVSPRRRLELLREPRGDLRRGGAPGATVPPPGFGPCRVAQAPRRDPPGRPPRAVPRQRDGGARGRLGMRHVLLAPAREAPPGCCPGDRIIARLSQLEAALDSGKIRAGGILAAGEGSRLRGDGWSMAKPLVPVEGVPLIERVLSNFLAAGIETVAVI